MPGMRVPAEDRAQVAVTVDGREYRQRNGYFHVDNDAHAAAILKEGNYGASWQTAPPVGRSSGYRCVDCHRGSFFVTCGKCGGDCVRES